MFAILPWLRAHKEWLENRARQNFWRGAVLFWVKLINATAAQVATKLSVYQQPPSPGSVWVTNDKEEVEQMSPNVGASDANADGREMRLMVSAGGGVPEYFLADGSMTNLATANKQELPALMGFAEYQDKLRDDILIPTFRRVIQAAVDAGVLQETVNVEDADGDPVEGPDGKVQTVAAVDAFDVVYPELERESPKDALEALLMGVNAELLSEETATGLLPWQVDYRQEQKRIAAEMERKMEQAMSGQRVLPFGGQGMQPYGQNGNPATEPQPEREPDGDEEQPEAA